MNPLPRRDEIVVPQPVEDIELSSEHLDDLLAAIRTAFRTPAAADQLLRRIGYPREQIPNFNLDPANAWNEVFHDLENGIIEAPFRRLLCAARRAYQANHVFRELAGNYLADDGSVRRAVAPDTAPALRALPPVPTQAPPTCHVIVSAESEDERLLATDILRRLGLDPVDVWSTGTAISFAVNSAEATVVRSRLDHTDLGWTLVPAGQPDYVYSNLYIEGPDRRRFRIVDAPAQQTFRNLTEDFITENYPQSDPHAQLPTVIERMRDGERHSVNPDSTLHDSGVQDGDELRVGYQTNAGSVHPQVHEDALYQARNQIRDFHRSAAARQLDFRVRANTSPALPPTEYSLEFRKRSYGMPPDVREGTEPVEVERHVVSLQLGPEFPVTPPQLWWMTPIFHPNIYPNYDSPKARSRPGARGLVCLGVIAESWQRALDFGDLCLMLADIAGFRNYAFVEVVETATGTSLKGNYYDERAVRWIINNPDRITAIGGEILFRHPAGRDTYRHTFEEIPR